VVEIVEATLNGAYTLKLPKHRADRPEWYTAEGWEKARMEALVKCIRSQDNPVVYYVGAEEGELAAICAMQGARMFLFEPNPRAWPNIKAVFEANDLVSLGGAACGVTSFYGFASNETKPDPPSFYSPFPDAAFGEVVGDHGFKELYLEAENYPQIRLDDVPNIPSWPPPTIITFDVEGSEWQVLKGARAILEHYKPVLFASIHPEFMFHQWGEYSSDFRGWIKAFGYREEILAYDHELHTVYYPL
jgi:FkbM family methyltransferase